MGHRKTATHIQHMGQRNEHSLNIQNVDQRKTAMNIQNVDQRKTAMNTEYVGQRDTDECL